MTSRLNLLTPFLLWPLSTHSRPFLEHAAPPVGSTVPASAPVLVITFSEGIEVAFSTIEVRDAGGTRVDRGDLHLVGDDGRRLGVSLPKLPPGRYMATWHVTSVDTHQTEGRFEFGIAP